MRESDICEIRNLPIFADMAESAFARLHRGAYVQTFPPQVDLFHEGEASDFLHVLTAGQVELFATWNRRETTMEIVTPVSSFLLAATIQDAPFLCSARTLEKSRVVLLPSENVRDVFDEDRAFARAVVRELAASYRGVVKSSKNIRLRSSIERLANYLLRYQDLAGGAESFALPLEKRKIASLLGMTPENLSRALRTLGEYGVQNDGQSITICDRGPLLRLAKPARLIDDPSS
ncbi:helix-turn-helix domain-containing protein [Rhodovulum strictum]|uniref:Helix-turn-helix domain-containing protein n=1 Tax=Rhodovulum strictum TaxID=58314 RepID=A0A844B5V7_9RHOB|nr:helix-turn-helix domain-containing protein [Rhodovulum strictum]MRH19764.1 helix-turn-helix domain-containing protein [Rhodovulum strictum]